MTPHGMTRAEYEQWIGDSIANAARIRAHIGGATAGLAQIKSTPRRDEDAARWPAPYDSHNLETS